MRLGAQPFFWKWVLFAWEWKMISISKAEHLPSLWNRDLGELGNGPLNKPSENETVGTGFGAPLSPSPCAVFRITLFKMHNCDTTALLSESLERARISVEGLGLLMCGSHSQVWHTNEGGKRSTVQLLIRNRKDSKPFLFSGILFLLKTGNRIECQFQVNAGY